MEASQPLSVESFSYRWLVNFSSSGSLNNSCRVSVDACDEASFIEMDPRLPPSKRFFKSSQDTKFDFPISESALVPADELFYNGHMVPLAVDQLETEAFEVSDSASSHPDPSHASVPWVPTRRKSGSSFRKCRRFSKKILLKYLAFFRPLCLKLRRSRSSTSIGSVGARLSVAKNRVHSVETSPRISVDWRWSCDSESSINDAVLHCKKSFGK